MTDFRTGIKKFSPGWLRRAVSERLMYGYGLMLDLITEHLWQGIKARFPGEGTPEALPFIGRDRQIVRGFAESDDSYILRLRAYLDSWKRAGSSVSVLSAIRGYVSPHTPVMRTVNRSSDLLGNTFAGWITTDGTGAVTYSVVGPTNWNWDGSITLWSRFWVIIYPPVGLWVSDGIWTDAGVWDDGGTWDTTATPEQVATIKSLVAQWKSAGSLCSQIIIAFNSGDFEPTDTSPPNPDGTWGNWGKLNAGNMEASRLFGASYWDGA